MDLEDYQKQEAIRENNRLASESNNLQRKQLDFQERQANVLKEQHEESLQLMRHLEEEKRVAQYEKDLDDNIYSLRLDITKTKDEDIRLGLQELLDEAIAKKDAYYLEKRERELAQKAAYEQQEAENQARLKKQKILKVLKSVLMTSLFVIVGIIAYQWFFATNTTETASSSFSTASSSSKEKSTAEKNKATKKQDSKITPTKVNFAVEVTDSSIDIYKNPNSSSEIVKEGPTGTYSIVETVESGNQTWGKLLTGEGWIDLAKATKVTDGNSLEVAQPSSEWEKSYSYYYVQTNTSTLMMAGFRLEAGGKVMLYRSGSELMAYNSGDPVYGTYTIENYQSKESVTSFVINQRRTVTGEMPITKLVLPNVVIKIHVPMAELKKGNGYATQDEDRVLYGYYSNLGQHILTDGISPVPQVYFKINE